MATPDPSQPARPSASAVTAADASPPEVEIAPEIEPLTPERALAWNRYYDRYLMGGVLLLVFLVSAHKITGAGGQSVLWTQLKTGELTARTGMPVTTDPYSYTEAGERWVNIPWIFEVVNHLLYRGGRTLFTADPAVGDQIGAGVLVAFNALARLLTVVLLLRLRRPGPGLWWFTVVAIVAMGGVPSPRGEQIEFSVGGIARQALIEPETWGLLLLAAEVLLLDRGLALGRKSALLAIPPLFLLWANLDDSFAFGLIVLWAHVLGSMLDRRSPKPWRPSPSLAALVLLGNPALCALNPSHIHIFPAAFGPLLAIPSMVLGSGGDLAMPDHLAYFGPLSTEFVAAGGGEHAPLFRAAYYFIVVLAGLATFALDRRRIAYGRLAVYIAAAILWAGLSRLSGEFAVVFAYVVGLNGQEWYQGRYGSAGRITPGWTAWSIGGRALTILALFSVMAKTLTGFGYMPGRPTFGLGVEVSDFDFEAADYLRNAKISGRVMNLGEAQGDALIWRAYPARKTFVDRRHNVFGPAIRKDLAAFRKSFYGEGARGVEVKDDPAQWRPILDKHEATAVLYSPRDNPLVFEAMRTSKNWIQLLDLGHTVLFGRADAPEEDLAFFKANRLDAEQIVYHRKQSLPFPDRSPSAITVIDRVIRNRALAPAQPHVLAANRWLEAGARASSDGLPDAAHCIMAIREARIALHFNPDESDAYRLLDLAYEHLVRNEREPLVGKTTSTPMEYLHYRARQRATVLNYAIQTTPPPRNAEEKQGLAELHLRLARVFRAIGDLDLERDNLAASLALVNASDFPPPEARRLEQLDRTILAFKEDLEKFTADYGADNLQRAARAMQSGFPGIAQHELEEAESQGVAADQLLSSLVNLYCRTGQPEKANERLAGRILNDPALLNGPGTPAYLHGLVNLLLGFYDNTVELWEKTAIPQAHRAETDQALAIGREFLTGQALTATRTTLELTGLPGKPGLIEIEANWEFELALCLLESGDSASAGAHFSRALLLDPAIATRPLIEDYLKKLGVPVPESAKPATDAKPADEPEKPADTPKPEPAEAKPESKPEPAEAGPDETKPEAKPGQPK